MNRRSFFALLASLPFAGKVIPQPDPVSAYDLDAPLHGKLPIIYGELSDEPGEWIKVTSHPIQRVESVMVNGQRYDGVRIEWESARPCSRFRLRYLPPNRA